VRLIQHCMLRIIRIIARMDSIHMYKRRCLFDAATLRHPSSRSPRSHPTIRASETIENPRTRKLELTMSYENEKDLEAQVQANVATVPKQHVHSSAVGILETDDGVPRNKGAFAPLWKAMSWFDRVGDRCVHTHASPLLVDGPADDGSVRGRSSRDRTRSGGRQTAHKLVSRLLDQTARSKSRSARQQD
jgi:hypothetical protein